MKNILSMWNITKEELNAAANELCAKGIAKGCFQNTNALLACCELLSGGDIFNVDSELRIFAEFIGKKYSVLELEVSEKERDNAVKLFREVRSND